MRTAIIMLLMISAVAVGVINKGRPERVNPKFKKVEVKSNYIYKESENKNTNYLEKEDSLNLIKS